MKKLIAIFLVTSVVGLQAQERMSLAEAQQYALSNNLSLRNANLSVDASKQKVWETIASGLPQISASGGYQHMLTEIPQLDLMGQQVAMGLKNNFTAGASLEQLIFSGSYIVGLQASKTFRAMSELGREKATIEITASVSQIYHLCLMTKQIEGILEENMSLLKKTLSELTAIKNHGLTDRTSVDQIEVTYNQVLAQYNSVCRERANSLSMLKYIIGMPMSEELILTDNIHNILNSINPDYMTLDGYDQEEHIDVKIAAMTVELQKLNLKLEKSAYLPNLGAKVGVDHIFTMPEFSFQKATTAYIGLGLNVPIFKSGMTKSKVRQAKISLEQSENEESMTRQSLDLAFQQALSAFQLAWDNHEVHKKNAILAARVLTDMQKSVTLGMKGSTDMIQSNADYLAAIQGEITAQYDLFNAKITLDKLLSVGQ